MANNCGTSGCPHNDTIYDESCGYDKVIDFQVVDCPAYTHVNRPENSHEYEPLDCKPVDPVFKNSNPNNYD